MASSGAMLHRTLQISERRIDPVELLEQGTARQQHVNGSRLVLQGLVVHRERLGRTARELQQLGLIAKDLTGLRRMILGEGRKTFERARPDRPRAEAFGNRELRRHQIRPGTDPLVVAACSLGIALLHGDQRPVIEGLKALLARSLPALQSAGLRRPDRPRPDRGMRSVRLISARSPYREASPSSLTRASSILPASASIRA